MNIIRAGAKAVFPELRGKLGGIRYPCFAEVKWDGEAAVINYNRAMSIPILSTNKYGAMRTQWSKLDKIKMLLEEKDIAQAMFLAEIYCDTGKNGSLYQLLSNKDNDNRLSIRIYDVCHITADDYEMIGAETPLIDRKEILVDIFKEEKQYLVRPVVMKNKNEVQSLFEERTQEGYEGIVVKNFDGNLIIGPCDWVKMKHKDQTDYRVCLIDGVKERIEVEVPNPSNNDIVTVGVKCVNKYKKTLSLGDIVTIEHQGVLESGSLRHPVFIGKAREEE